MNSKQVRLLETVKVYGHHSALIQEVDGISHAYLLAMVVLQYTHPFRIDCIFVDGRAVDLNVPIVSAPKHFQIQIQSLGGYCENWEKMMLMLLLVGFG